jgi:hypothetical protein
MAEPTDFFNILDPTRPERVLVLDPKEMEQRGGKRLVAETMCRIRFQREEDIAACIELLRASDEALKARPEELKRWSWESTFREGMDIVFGVAWYDLEFFMRRKDAFKDVNHAAQYARFNVKVEDLEVEHEILEPGKFRG